MRTRKPEKSEVYKVAKIVIITLISVSVISSVIYFTTDRKEQEIQNKNNSETTSIQKVSNEQHKTEEKVQTEKKFYLIYSPTCPHCHNAMKFIDGDLKAKYKNVNFEYVNVQTNDGLKKYKELVKKHNIKTNGVPVAIIGSTVILGFGQATQQEYIDGIEALLKE